MPIRTSSPRSQEVPREEVILVADDGTIMYANPHADTFPRIGRKSAERVLPSKLAEIHARFVESGKGSVSATFQCESTGVDSNVFIYKVYSLAGQPPAGIIFVKRQEDAFSVPTFTAQAMPASIRGDLSTSALQPGPQFRSLKGRAKSFRKALIQAQKAAGTGFPILIVGESGTGKEGVAKSIHEASDRTGKPFVDINCAAIPDSLIESELFGYEGGSFTGARRTGRTGLFDLAHGGTVFLDEIGDASPQTQAKILRVLQEGRFKRIGGKQNVEVDFRPISATNRNLKDPISQGGFRPDLFYRLNTITINLPPLRERHGDIRLLAEHFLSDHAQDQGKSLAFSAEAMRLMEAYKWPGNVRELKGVVDYAATMASTPILTADCLPSFMKEKAGSLFEESEAKRLSSGDMDGPGLLHRTLQDVERTLIKQVLSESRTRSEAIRTLGISRRTFYLKIKQYGLA